MNIERAAAQISLKCRASGRRYLFFHTGAPGLLISRSYGRVMPARFASRLAVRRAVPPPSLFPSPSLGVIGSPIPSLHEMRKASRQAFQKRHHHPSLGSDLMTWAAARKDLSTSTNSVAQPSRLDAAIACNCSTLLVLSWETFSICLETSVSKALDEFAAFA